MPDGKSRRGFASMSEEKRRRIASKGGKAAHHSRGNQTLKNDNK